MQVDEEKGIGSSIIEKLVEASVVYVIFINQLSFDYKRNICAF
jgi:hypothetical protein